MNIKTAMKLLGLTSSDNKETIKSKWRQKMKEHHPDKYAEQGEDAVKQATEKSKLINVAYEFVIQYIDCFGFDDFITSDDEQNKQNKEEAFSNQSIEDVFIEDEVFDRTFTDSLFGIWMGFDHPYSNLIRNIRKYKVGEEYRYFIKYSVCEVNPKANIGDSIDLMGYDFVSCGYDKYEILNSCYIEEYDRCESDYFDDSIIHYIRAGFIKCSRMVIKSLEPFCVELTCSNNIENIECVPNKIKYAIKSTYIQTLMAYKKIYQPETMQSDGRIIFKSVYASDVNKCDYSIFDMHQILGAMVQNYEFKRELMFYHYSSRMKYYHGHTGVLHFEISLEKAEEIFGHTLVLDKMINSNKFYELLGGIEGQKVFIKRLRTVTAVTTINSKTAKNGKLSYNFDTIFYDNDDTMFLNGEIMVLGK